MTEASFYVDQGMIRVESKYEHAERCRSVPGGKWNRDIFMWEWPASPRVACELRDAFKGVGNCRASKTFMGLVADGDSQRAARTVRAEQSDGGPAPLVPLWSHQSDAVRLAMPHEGFYLAHDMGAGKTLTTIALMLKRRHRKMLVFAPKRVVPGWAEQIERFAGDAIVPLALTKGTVAKRTQAAATAYTDYEPVCIITNYECLQSPDFREWANKQHWDLIVCDEAHRIKAPNGVTSKALATLGRRADYRLCLSGTPFAHNPLDIYGQFRFLDPNVFGTSWVRFRATYAIMGGYGGKEVVGYRDLEKLHQKFYAVAHRVMTADVVDLPEFRDEVINVEMSTRAQTAYRDIADNFFAEVETGQVTVANALTRLLRLQQITSGYLPDDDGNVVRLDNAKEDALAELLQDFPLDEPVVIFAVFRNDLQAIQHAAQVAGRNCGEISGERDDYDLWREGKVNTLAVQLQAGGEGLNDLVRARYCVYYSVGFSLARYNQSRARIVRPGQKRNVVYYHLVAKDTVDQAVYKALSSRQEVIESILKRDNEHGAGSLPQVEPGRDIEPANTE